MIKKSCPARELRKSEGGVVDGHALVLATREECYGHVRLFNRMILDPGQSISYHTHGDETEFYYILSGTPTVNDNGQEVLMEPGQVMVTGNGDSHAMENRTDGPVELIAMIVCK